MHRYIYLNNYSAFFQLFVVYYFALLKLSYLAIFGKEELVKKPNSKINRLIDKLQNKLEDEFFDIYNEGDEKSKKIKIIKWGITLIGSTRFKPKWNKVKAKYNPIYLLFGFYCLALLFLGGVEQSYIQKAGDPYTNVRINFVYFYLYWLTLFVFVVFLFLIFFQKVDKKNGHPSFFYRNPHVYIFVIYIVIAFLYLVLYKIITIFPELRFTAYIQNYNISYGFYFFSINHHNFLYFIMVTVLTPVVFVFAYPTIRGRMIIIRAYLFYFITIIVVRALQKFNKFINKVGSEALTHTILVNQGIPIKIRKKPKKKKS